MSNHPRGNLAPASRYASAKRDLTDFEQEQARLKDLVAESTQRLVVLDREIAQAKSRLAHEQLRVDSEQHAFLLAELRELLAVLDKSWSSVAERRVGEIFAAFRMAKLSGQDARAFGVYVDALKNPKGGQPRRTWAGLLSWVHLQASAA